MLQSILHILARQLRLLEQDVEIKIDELTSEYARAEAAGSDDESGTYSSSSAEEEEDEQWAERGRRDERRERKDRARKEEKGVKTDRTDDTGSRKSKRTGEKEDGKASSKHRKGKASSEDREGKASSEDREGKGSSKYREGKASSEDREGKRHSKDRGGKDKRSKGKDKHSRDRDGRGGRGGENEDRDAQGKHRDAQGKRREGRDFGRQTSGTSITVSAESGPAARVRPARIGSIEVVTASQFELLGKAVKELQRITGPLPEPVLPDNETLRQDLATGRASLQDTMEAVQLNARVQAAEQGLYRMAELLTQLAQSGILPPKFASQVGAIDDYLEAAKAARRVCGLKDTRSTASPTATWAESQVKTGTGVTHKEMYDVVNQTKDAVFLDIDNLTARANHSADVASNTARRIADKLDIAMQVDGRVTTLLELTKDYATEVRGFDSGIILQVNNFQEQVTSMRKDLAAGLALLDVSNDNAQSAALLDLKDHRERLDFELENIFHLHQDLDSTKLQINEEIMSLLQCVEILREQKSDRDEVLDALRDKADLTRLNGLLWEKDFAIARGEIDNRLMKFYDMFDRQDTRWRVALSELMDIANNKADIILLMALRDKTDTDINAIQMLLNKLETMLGEPKAAVLMRKLAKDASCGACLTRALMEPVDPTYGKPLPLPALRPPPLGAEQQPCYREPKLVPPDIRDHICRRWVGGSHTMLARNIAKVKAQPMKLQIIPTKKFQGYGFDGKLYMMEEDMLPCVECNQLSTDEAAPVSPYSPTSTGGGDQASAPTRR